MKGYRILSGRDKAMLHFLWRWKFATTTQLAMMFYRDSSAVGAYNRLWRLERSGIVASICTPDRKRTFWTLTDSTFKELVKPELLPLCHDGYKSEAIEHDFLVNAAHLGELVVAGVDGLELFSEQELRAVDVDFYPSWVPKSKIHRPDGYTLVKNGREQSILAFEVERSLKKYELYENVARFYNEDTTVSDILWFVNSKSIAAKIQARFDKAIGAKAYNHSFFLIGDLEHELWQCASIAGKRIGQTLCEIHARTPQEVRELSRGPQFFDTRKNPIKPRTNAKPSGGQFRDRVAKPGHSKQILKGPRT